MPAHNVNLTATWSIVNYPISYELNGGNVSTSISFFYGLVGIHRYHNEKPGSTVGTGKERFVYMHDFIPTNQLIYDWYMFDSDNVNADQTLIANFRSAMIVND